MERSPEPDPGMGQIGAVSPPPKKPLWRSLWEILEVFFLAALLFAGIQAISARIRIESISMVPTLEPGNYVIVEKVSYLFRLPRRGEIVVFDLPRDPSQRYIKRVIGLPGEEVRIHAGQVYVDDRLLDEPYVRVQTHQGGTWQIPADSVFVLGDNRNNSSDSRVWGVVSADKLIGKALFIYWPLDRLGALDNAVYAAGRP